MNMQYKLEAFEGPLDLLLHLIDKNKVNIYDIPIVEITRQYLEYIEGVEWKNLDSMSEFLVMAATLVDIKSKMLLPAEIDEDGEEIDPRRELVDQLLQYKMFKYISFELKDRQVDGEKIWIKDASLPEEVAKYREPVDVEALCKDVDLTDLNRIFKELMRRQEDKIDTAHADFGRIKKDPVSVTDKLTKLTNFARSHKSFSFSKMLSGEDTKMDIVVMFIAVLEMVKIGHLTVQQKDIFGDITIASNLYGKEDRQTEITYAGTYE